MTKKQESYPNLREACLWADVSRLMGNPNWQDTFTRFGEHPILNDFQKVCTPALLDKVYENLR
jgi:hypothetical protein